MDPGSGVHLHRGSGDAGQHERRLGQHCARHAGESLVRGIRRSGSSHARICDPEKHARKTSMFQTICELGFNVFGLVWLLLLPQHPFLILGPAAAVLKFGPIWHIFYVPTVLLAAAVILRSAIILGRPRWTSFPLWSQLVQALLTLILVHYMIEAAGHTVQGNWHPFVMVADSVRSSEQYARFSKIVAIVNVAGLITIVCTWIGVCIGGAVHTWELLKYIRKQRSVSERPASLQAQ